MNKQRIYRFSIAIGLVALVGLLVVQVYWFAEAYAMEEKQFHEKANLAIREVVNELLSTQGDHTTAIAPVRAVASNSFTVDYNRFISYAQLDSLLRTVFVKHNLLVPFEMNVYESNSRIIAFGNWYSQGVLSESQPVCLKRTLPKQARMNFTITFPHKNIDVVNGMSIWIFSAVTFMLILILMAFIMIDLSRQKKLAELKADFVNNMTHELQTPIANISLASEVLIKSNGLLSEEKTMHYMDIIAAENQRLKIHVDQVLQTTMLEKGELPLNKTEIDINSVIEEVLKSFRLRIQNRGGHLEVNLNASKPLIMADPFHLKNIFFSLLDNADKYSPVSPEITVTTVNDDHGVCVEFKDNGLGIDHKAQPYIFDKFFRVSRGNVHDIKGFGLGLTYVREVVTAHQGKVSVSSVLNQGSCFELHFQNC